MSGITLPVAGPTGSAKRSAGAGKHASPAYSVGRPRTAIKSEIPSNVYNAKSDLMAPARAAIARVRGKQGQAVFAAVGQSTFRGNDLGTGSNGHNGAQPLCLVSQIAYAMRSRGLNVSLDGMFGTGKVLDNQLALWDSRLYVGAGWGATGQEVLGGDILRNSTSASGTVLRFTPTGKWDTVVFFDKTDPSGPTSAIRLSYGGQVDADVLSLETNIGAVISQNLAGNPTFRKIVRSTGVAAAVQPLNIKRAIAAAGVAYVAGWHCYDSTDSALALYNMGRAGLGAAVLGAYDALKPWQPNPSIGQIGADCILVEIGINDWNNALTDVSTFLTNLDAFLVAAKATGATVVLVGSPPTSTVPGGAASVVRQQQFRDGMQTLAITRGCVFIDEQKIFGDWATANAAGMTASANHYNLAGVTKMGKNIASIF